MLIEIRSALHCSAHLEGSGVEIGAQQLERVGGRWVKRGRRSIQRGEGSLGRLPAVGPRLAAPAAGEEKRAKQWVSSPFG